MQPEIPGGYAITPRKLFYSIFLDKPPLWVKLWDWMLLTASHKDHKNLKRGQFFTSASKMQEAMSWKVGARLQKPTIKQIRSAYEGLMKVGAVGTTKVTGGMIVTIINYDHYQNPKNYEGRTERRDEKSLKGNDQANHNNKKGNKKGKTISFSSDSDEVRLSSMLFSLINTRNPNHRAPNIQAWARHVDRMIRLDKRTPDEIEKVIRWSQADLFWQNNILSTEKLRKQFDALWLKMRPTDQTRKTHESIEYNSQEWTETDSNQWHADPGHNNGEDVPSPRAIHG